MSEPTLFTPIELGGLRLKNRILFAPTTLGLGAEETVQKLRRIAAGGCFLPYCDEVRRSKECLGGIQQHRGVHCIYDKKEHKIV